MGTTEKYSWLVIILYTTTLLLGNIFFILIQYMCFFTVLHIDTIFSGGGVLKMLFLFYENWKWK